ncbi:hypothetical protein D3C80_1723330 [compost metagenome]
MTPDFAGRRKTVKNHLLQAQIRLTTVQRFPVIATGAGTRGGVVSPFTTITTEQIDLGQVPTLSRLELVVGRQTIVHPCLDFRVDIQCLLHGLGQGLGLYKTGGEGEG